MSFGKIEIVNNGPKCLTGSQTSLKNLNKLKKTSNFTDPVNLLRPRLFQSYFTSTIAYIPRQGSLSLVSDSFLKFSTNINETEESKEAMFLISFISVVFTNHSHRLHRTLTF